MYVLVNQSTITIMKISITSRRFLMPLGNASFLFLPVLLRPEQASRLTPAACHRELCSTGRGVCVVVSL